VVALKAPSYPGMLFQTSSANVKIRNCILLNPVGDGIYCTWQGKEIVNNFIINTFCAAVETRSAQPNSVIHVRNTTFGNEDTIMKNKVFFSCLGFEGKGRAFDFKNQNYSYPAGIVIEVGKKQEATDESHPAARLAERVRRNLV
jgi:hypothetical protein